MRSRQQHNPKLNKLLVSNKLDLTLCQVSCLEYDHCKTQYPYDKRTGEEMTTRVILQTEQTVSVSSEAVLLDSKAQEIEQAIADFNEAKKLIKELEAQKAAAEKVLREALGSASVGLVNGVERIKISTRTRKDINKDDLKEAYPEAYQLCLKESTYTVLTATS